MKIAYVRLSLWAKYSYLDTKHICFTHTIKLLTNTHIHTCFNSSTGKHIDRVLRRVRDSCLF